MSGMIVIPASLRSDFIHIAGIRTRHEREQDDR
jgi:hypothetical protein